MKLNYKIKAPLVIGEFAQSLRDRIRHPVKGDEMLTTSELIQFVINTIKNKKLTNQHKKEVHK